MMTRTHALVLGALALVVAGPTACKEQSSTTVSDAAVNANQMELTDPKLREALSAPSASPASQGGAEDGPPARGVFEAGQADARHKAGAPLTIQIGSEGAEPRIALGPGTAEVKGPIKLKVGVHTGPRSALPSVDLTLGLKYEKSKEKLPDGTTAAPVLVAKVDKAVLSASQPGQVPAGTDKEIAKLGGSVMRLVPAARGGAEDIQLTVGKDVSAELKFVLFGAADAVFAMNVAVPDKPMGVGGAWIAESRNKFSGVDVVSYRLYRVKSIEAGAVTLEVELRQYASSTQDSIEGLPPGGLQQFDSTGRGSVKLGAGETMAQQGDFEQRRTMVVQDGQRMLNVQLQTDTKLTR
jgi:hypothetical protein